MTRSCLPSAAPALARAAARPLLLGTGALVVLSTSSTTTASSRAAVALAAPAPHAAAVPSAAGDLLAGREDPATSRGRDREPLAGDEQDAAAAARAEAGQQALAAAAQAQRQAQEAAVAARGAAQAAYRDGVAAAVADPRGAARPMVADRGWGPEQFDCLDSLWTKESGWLLTADNPSSSAYGIPQALPGERMASAGEDWRTNPRTQITWGLEYIAASYGTPCGAWAHSRAVDWY